MKKSFWQVSILVGSALLLGSCGNKKTQPTQPNAAIIRGVVSPPREGVTSLRTNENNELGVSTTVQPDGRFTLALPNTNTMLGSKSNLLFPVKSGDAFGACENVVSNAPDTLKIYPVNYLVTNTGKRLISPINPDKPTYNYRAFWFSNQDATVSFKGNCLGLGNIDTTLTLKKGWNVVETDTNVGVSTTYQVVAPSDAVYTWRPDTSMTGQALKYNVLAPWRNLAKYADR